jgi:hypothetical protein
MFKVDMEAVYDELCYLADVALKKHNPCQFDTVTKKCLRGKKNGCCTGCPHLTNTGCSVQSLACKLWVCFNAREASPELEKIRLLAHESGLMGYHELWDYARLSKAEFFAKKKGKNVRYNRPDNKYI